MGEAPIELRRAGKVHRVEIDRLTSFMKGRVDALIKASKSSVVQNVRAEKSSGGESPVDLAEIALSPTAGHPHEEDEHAEFKGMLEQSFGPAVEEVFVDAVPGAPKRRPAKPKRAQAPSAGAWFRQRYPTVAKQGKPLPANAADTNKIESIA